MKKKIEDKIAKTFTCTYDQKEDRIKLTLNYQDPVERVDFWITRSFLLRLLPLLSKFGSAKDEMSVVSGNQTNEEVAPAPSTPTDESMLMLTQKEPILLEQVDFGKSERGVNIVFSSPLSPRYTALLKAQEVDTLANLLIKAAPTYEWGIGPWWR